jgi:hypothetical protein
MLWFVTTALAMTPGFVPVQGSLTTPDGAAVTGTRTATFALYSAPSGGDLLYTGTYTLALEGGAFSALLGASPHPFDLEALIGSSQAWLQVTLAGDPPSDPVPVGVAPLAGYAMFAGSAGDAATLGGLDPDAFMPADATVPWSQVDVPSDLADGDDGQDLVFGQGFTTSGANVALNLGSTLTLTGGQLGVQQSALQPSWSNLQGTPTSIRITPGSFPTSFTGLQPSALAITGGIPNGSVARFTVGNDAGGNYAGLGVRVDSGGTTMMLGTSNNYANGITNTAVTIDPAGRVGIGTTPAANLDVAGSIRWGGRTFSRITYCRFQGTPSSAQASEFYRKWVAADCDNGVPAGTCLGFLNRGLHAGGDQDWTVVHPGETLSGAHASIGAFPNGGMYWWTSGAATLLDAAAVYFCNG